MAKNGHFGIPGVNFKRRQNHTIWGSFESSWLLEIGKIMKKISVKKMALGRNLVKIRKITIERQNGAQSKAHVVKNTEKILKNNIIQK